MTAFYKAPEPWISRQDPEDGVKARRVSSYANSNGKRAVMGFACDAGVKRNKGRPGARQAPQAIRKALASLAAPSDFSSFADLGDIVVEDNSLEDGQTLLAEQITTNLTKFERIVVLGGGHETAFGSYRGLKTTFPKKKIGIINLDAHLDLRNIGEAGPSSGTPFNQIRSLDPNGFDYLCIGVAKESNSEALFERAKDWGVGIISDKDLLHDIHAANVAIDQMTQRCDILYLTIDIDVLPHYQAPGVSAPAARGVSFAVIEHLIHHALTCCKGNHTVMPLADIVEVSPSYDRDGMTSRTASYLALSLLCN